MFRRRMLVAISLLALACGSGGAEPTLLLAKAYYLDDEKAEAGEILEELFASASSEEKTRYNRILCSA